ncbi:MAG: hypothetical protein Greene101447_501, partial [Parcubacteria group bacterium Greene1014_47]
MSIRINQLNPHKSVVYINQRYTYFVALFILVMGAFFVPSIAQAQVACTAPTLNTAYTISTSCGFDELVHGSDAGMTVNALTTLTVKTGQTIVWAPGSALVINGTIIISSTAKLQQTYLWQQDADLDGYPDQTRMYTGLTAPAGATYQKRSLMTTYATVDSYPTTAATATPSFSPDTSSTLTTGLVGYWKLNETSGTSAADS